MPTLQEMTAWSADEIVGAIRIELPANVHFDCGFDREAGVWRTSFWREREGHKIVLYEEWGFEQRITYLNAYGWLWMQKQPKPPAHSPWVRRREVTPHMVQRTAVRHAPSPDPADVDPSELEAVYASLRGKPKKG